MEPFYSRLVTQKIKKVITPQIPYSTQIRQDAQSPRELTATDLDEIDDALEQIVSRNQDPKHSMLAAINQTYDQVKQDLVSALDGIFKSVYQLAEDSSKYIVFENLVSEFQDLKSEFELQPSPAGQSRMLESLRRVVSVEDLPAFDTLADADSLKPVLEAFAKAFSKNRIKARMHSLYDSEVSHIVQAKLASTDTISESLNLQKQQIVFAHDAGESTRARFVTDPVLVKLKSDLQPSSSQDAQIRGLRQEMCKFLNDMRAADPYTAMYTLSRKQHLALCVKPVVEPVGERLLERMRRYHYPSRFRHKAESVDLVDLCAGLGPESVCSVQFEGHLRHLVLSGSERYFAVERKECKTLFYEISGDCRAMTPLIELNERLVPIWKFVFVDSRPSERMVHVSAFGRLFVYDLAAQSREISLAAGVKSVHYIDSQNVLVLTHNNCLGVFSVELRRITSLVQCSTPFDVFRKVCSTDSRVSESLSALRDVRNRASTSQVKTFATEKFFKKLRSALSAEIKVTRLAEPGVLCLRVHFCDDPSHTKFYYYLRYQELPRESNTREMRLARIDRQKVYMANIETLSFRQSDFCITADTSAQPFLSKRSALSMMSQFSVDQEYPKFWLNLLRHSKQADGTVELDRVRIKRFQLSAAQDQITSVRPKSAFFVYNRTLWLFFKIVGIWISISV